MQALTCGRRCSRWGLHRSSCSRFRRRRPRSVQAVAPQLEPWVSFKQDATVWAAVLTGAGVDVTAQQELFLLSTHSRDGWEAANALIAKILKKQSDRAPLQNPSAFIHVCCTKARSNIAGGWGPAGSEP